MKNKKTFNDLGLSDKSLEAINQKGFEEPTEIQALTIPAMLRNDTNIIAQAQTGTGKTAAFGLPLIEMIDPDMYAVQALILVPTRELAIQVSEEISSLRGEKAIRTVPIYGGQAIDQQLRRLKKGAHIVVGSPGRVLDHLRRKTLDFTKIQHLVLDEADEMLNMGFIEDMEEIFKHTNPDKRTLLFSATMPDKIKELARRYMDGYQTLTAKKKQLTANLTEQIYVEVKASDKLEALCRILDIEENFYGMIFCRTKMDVDCLVSHLNSRGFDVEAIHGDIVQAQRERTLDNFKRQGINILVATDVAARGIDVNNLTHVINYSLPQDPESYVHRIGRTGRAGNEGTAITFITPAEYSRLMFIQRMSGSQIKKLSVPKVKDIIKAKKKKISDDLKAAMEAEGGATYLDWASKLIGDGDPAQVLAAVLGYCFDEDLNPENYGEVTDLGPKGKPIDLPGTTRLFVALGKKDGMTVQKLIKLVTSRVKMQPKNISGIQIMEKFTFMTVPFAQAETIIASFKEKGRKPLITHVKK